tara:strand:+ start:2080 stop:2865 length:786 start_codon:yes stop_codon:yes gene_type:complete
MEYLTGYTIKPHTVTGLGEVRFTDGTNTDMGANQVTCEAYGYTYDIATGTCVSFRFNTNLNRNINNINNKNNGSNNTNELGSNTVQINGSNNTTKGFNNNCLINGSGNEIANGLNNVTVLGSKGNALNEGELRLGGGGATSTSLFLLDTTTTNATNTRMLINGNSPDISIDHDQMHGYTVYIMAYQSSGETTNRAFFKLEGMIIGTTVTETLTTIVSTGTVTGWSASTYVASDYVNIRVTGAAATTIKWAATARYNELIIT